MLLRVWTVIVWALVAASAAFWGLRLFVAAPAMPAQALPAAGMASAQADLTRLLGSDPVATEAAAAPADARYQLLGVVTPRAAGAAREGLALIAVDGKPARAYRIGATVSDSAQLQAVNPRGATLASRDGNGGSVALTLAPPAPAATGTLPAAAGATYAPPPSMLPARPFRPNFGGAPATAAPASPPPAHANVRQGNAEE